MFARRVLPALWAHEVRGPWPARLRTALLMPWFPVRGRVRLFNEVSLSGLKRYEPQALAGCVGALREIAEESLEARPLLPSLTHGVLAITATGRPMLSAEDRELLWDAFQVPVWEQCRCWDGTLFAEECEAHEGLHLRDGTYPVAPPGSVVLYERCACGDPTPRIIAAETSSARPKELAAAAAAAGPMLSL